MIAVRGARLVLPGRILEGGTLLCDGPTVVDVVADGRSTSAHEVHDRSGAIIVPGFIDVHVHGIEGLDTLDGETPIAAIAARLVKYGVTAFCPTTVACSPGDLARVLAAVAQARRTPPPGARVLPAHLESNFIDPEYRGAQPLACLRRPPAAAGARDATPGAPGTASPERQPEGQGSTPGGDADYTGQDILRAIERGREATALVTLAAELPGGLDLVRVLVGLGLRVSLGHSGATHAEAHAGFDAGARHATHLFNRMAPLHHREPGLAGAALERDDVDAEIVCDGFHVHPSMVRLALRLKSPDRVIAITDGTGGSGFPVGSRVRLGGRPITVRDTAAFLDDGTLAGSTLTMDQAYRRAVASFGCSLVEAARLCATNPARALGLSDRGSLGAGMQADFVVLDDHLDVVETWVGGERAWSRPGVATA